MSRNLIDPYSDTWKTIERWADERLAHCRAKLEAPERTGKESRTLRARIQELLALRKLKDAPAETPADNSPPQY